MANLRDILTAKAITVIPGDGYNAFRSQYQNGDGWLGAPLHFEDVLSPDGPERSLADRVVPALVRFLKRKKQDPENPRNVLVALFLGESCFMIQADVLLEVYCELEGTTRQALHFRMLSWLA
jgi:hypothetical protein